MWYRGNHWWHSSLQVKTRYGLYYNITKFKIETVARGAGQRSSFEFACTASDRDRTASLIVLTLLWCWWSFRWRIKAGRKRTRCANHTCRHCRSSILSCLGFYLLFCIQTWFKWTAVECRGGWLNTGVTRHDCRIQGGAPVLTANSKARLCF